MKILVFEYITGGGLASERHLPASLAQEGDLMLQALLRDLSELPEVEIWVCRDVRLPPPQACNIQVLPVQQGGDVAALIDTWMNECDAVWPIAPETGALLESFCARVQAAGKLLLTSPAAAVRVCGDKLHTFELLQQHAIPAVTAWPLPRELPAANRQWVVKARDGVGCADSYIIDNAADYRVVSAALSDPDNFILQALTPGRPVSLSCLFKQGQATLLSYNEQQIAIRDRHFHLQGCVVNAPCPDWDRYLQLAAQVAAALPSLWGYAGVDLLDTPDGPLILEINPRLTTSYAGLHQAQQDNVARHILNLLHDGLPPSVARGQPVTVTIPQGAEYGE